MRNNKVLNKVMSIILILALILPTINFVISKNLILLNDETNKQIISIILTIGGFFLFFGVYKLIYHTVKNIDEDVSRQQFLEYSGIISGIVIFMNMFVKMFSDYRMKVLGYLILSTLIILTTLKFLMTDIYKITKFIVLVVIFLGGYIMFLDLITQVLFKFV